MQVEGVGAPVGSLHGLARVSNTVLSGEAQTGALPAYAAAIDKERLAMIDGLVAGKLYGVAEQRLDKGNKPFVVCKVRAASSDGEMLFVNVIAFDEGTSALLLALADGESVALSGSVTPRVWTDKQGNTRPSLDMVAHRALTAHDVQHRRSVLESTGGPQD